MAREMELKAKLTISVSMNDIRGVKMKIGVVIVTRNRLKCLINTLELYDKQTKKPEYILVVNNCSTDGQTHAYLEQWITVNSSYKKIVIHSDVNGGGSGGFYIAESEAVKLNADWIWHADDDAYPDVDALKSIETAYLTDNTNVVAYCAAVKNVDHHEEDISHWMKLYKGVFFTKWIPIKKNDKYFDVDKFMYLGCVVKKDALIEVGLTNKDFFIHEDDIEHSMRLKKHGRIVAVTDSYLYHPAWNDVIDPDKINWKHYYSIRNKIQSIGINLGKRYLFGELVKAEIKHFSHIIKSYPQRVIDMENDAIKDGVSGKLGKNDRYLPQNK